MEGHVILLEYLEEKPLLLSRPGNTYSAPSSASPCVCKQCFVTSHVRAIALLVPHIAGGSAAVTGMGVRLTTYYRKKSATDNADLQKLVNGGSGTLFPQLKAVCIRKPVLIMPVVVCMVLLCSGKCWEPLCKEVLMQ